MNSIISPIPVSENLDFMSQTYLKEYYQVKGLA